MEEFGERVCFWVWDRDFREGCGWVCFIIFIDVYNGKKAFRKLYWKVDQ